MFCYAVFLFCSFVLSFLFCMLLFFSVCSVVCFALQCALFGGSALLVFCSFFVVLQFRHSAPLLLCSAPLLLCTRVALHLVTLLFCPLSQVSCPLVTGDKWTSWQGDRVQSNTCTEHPGRRAEQQRCRVPKLQNHIELQNAKLAETPKSAERHKLQNKKCRTNTLHNKKLQNTKTGQKRTSQHTRAARVQSKIL